MGHLVICVSRDRPVKDAPEHGQIQVLRSHRKYDRSDDKVVQVSSAESAVAAPSGCHLMCDKNWVEALVGASSVLCHPK
jgi:hypothetical protein